MYQITHYGEGKIVDFTPHQVVIKDLKGPIRVLATRIIDVITSLYKFDNFGSSSFPLVFVSQSDEVIKLGHDYHSLQTPSKEKMVTCLPMEACRDGVCFGCVLIKHY